MSFFKSLSVKQAKNMSPLSLAYVGDAVHGLIVREKLVDASDAKTKELHRLATGEVNAAAQARLAEKVFETLTDDEKDIFMRGRNGKTHHVAKNQTLHDYKLATAIEAVIGYLYLTGKTERILQLLCTGETTNEDRR
ncbi:MAG: ribonuclease III [Corallococcus sp.]|nr:ribonuclease III [Corallococcus sp.]